MTPKANESSNVTVSSPSEASEGSSDAETYDEWVQHMRVIEFLRKYVRDRLHRHDYEETLALGRGGGGAIVDVGRSHLERPLYPPLPRVA